MQAQIQAPELLKLPEVMRMTKHSKTTIYDLIKKGEFPAQVKRGRASFWKDSEVQEWIDNLAPASH